MDDIAKLKQRIRRLERARDKWKARASAKQQHIRTLTVRARDLALSRDLWKHRAGGQRPAAPADEPPRLLALPACGPSPEGGKTGPGRP